jgi:addiction module HigA family antidote
MRPIHPGEILREEYLLPLDMSASALAQVIGVPANRVSLIVAGERAVTADTALRLARALGTTPEFWLNLQQRYELRLAEVGYEERGCPAHHPARRRGVAGTRGGVGRSEGAFGRHRRVVCRRDDAFGRQNQTIGRRNESIGRTQETIGRTQETIGRTQTI